MRGKEYSQEFKEQVISDIIRGTKTHAQACREYEIASSTISTWMGKYKEGCLQKNTSPKDKKLLKKIAQLERKIGQQAFEIDLLKKAKKSSEELRKRQSLIMPVTGISTGGAK